MIEDILDNEPTIRLTIFLAVLGTVAAWEALSPRRARSLSRWLRWPSNLGIVALNTVVVRLLFPAAAIGMAWYAKDHGWGLFNAIEVPAALAVAATVVALDLFIYLQHVMFHAVPALWRLHRMHHTDIDFDVTTGARFHPIEIVLSMVIKLAAVVVLGAPPVAVVIFEVILNATSMFNQGNVRLHPTADRYLRWLVVTPDMHRVHHSVIPAETNSTFGFNLPWWDRLFGTYQVQPSAGHEKMEIGLRQFRDSARLTLPWILVLPFVGRSSGYALGSRSDKLDHPDQDQ